MTALRKEFGNPQAKEILRNRAKILRSRLSPEYQQLFSEAPIDLQSDSASSRLAFYEPGHVFGVRYENHNLPDEEKLRNDLSVMLELYRLATMRGGVNELNIDTPIGDPLQPTDIDTPLEEKRNIRYHRVIERNRRLANRAKDIHGYTCQVCAFDFFKRYGELGREYIEAHHKIPISILPENRTKLSPRDDFAVVCSNCHRMIHRKG
nr:DUF3578 domain-containing protein [Pyrinomonadaceae bacterium]